MASLADAITTSIADRYDSQKQAVSKVMTSESRKSDQEVIVSKLMTGKEVRKELKLARKDKKPDQDWINFLVSLLAEASQS